MPSMVSRKINYTSDVDGVAREITFKIRADYQDQFDFYEAPDQARCSGNAGLFKMRALIGKHDDGSTIRFPIATNAGIVAAINTLTGAGFACVDLDGEEWGIFPGKGNPDAEYAVPAGFSDKESGTFDYTSDLTGNVIKAKVAIEKAPNEISSAAIDCAGEIEPTAICAVTAQGFKTRAIIAIAKNTTTQGKIVRKAPSPQLSSVVDCRDAMAEVALCVGYKGESARNAHLYLV